MSELIGGPNGGGIVTPGRMVPVPVEVAIIAERLDGLTSAVRDLVEVQKNVNNALVALAGLGKGDTDANR